MPTASEVIGVRLKVRREELGLTVIELAERLNVTRQTIYRWESGEDTPHLDKQTYVADVLDVEWADLFRPSEVA